MACDIASLYTQSDKTLSATISQRKSSDLVFAEGRTFSLFSKIILSPNQLLAMNLLDLPDRLIKL